MAWSKTVEVPYDDGLVAAKLKIVFTQDLTNLTAGNISLKANCTLTMEKAYNEWNYGYWTCDGYLKIYSDYDKDVVIAQQQDTKKSSGNWYTAYVDGWVVDDNGNGGYWGSSSVNFNIDIQIPNQYIDTKVYIQWDYVYMGSIILNCEKTKNNFVTITYDSNGGTGELSSPQTLKLVSDKLLNSAPVKNKYAFMGWRNITDSTDKNLYLPGSEFDSSYTDVTLQAVWEEFIFADWFNNIKEQIYLACKQRCHVDSIFEKPDNTDNWSTTINDPNWYKTYNNGDIIYGTNSDDVSLEAILKALAKVDYFPNDLREDFYDKENISSEEPVSINKIQGLLQKDLIELLIISNNMLTTDLHQTDCRGSCAGLCSTTCIAECSGGCGDNCKEGCKGQCTSCSGGCGKDCSGTCGSNCSGACTGCSADCQTNCNDGCYGSCLNGCYSGCKGNCQYTCYAMCHYCDWGCSASCWDNCGNTCEGYSRSS